jgi:biotin carboxyl carrier protein
MRYVTTVEGRDFTIEVQKDQLIVDGQAHTIDLRRIEPLSLYSLLVGNHSHELLIEEQREQYGVMLQGKLYTVRVHPERDRDRSAPGASLTAANGQMTIEAPMPGRVLKTLAHVGQAKEAGEVLIVMESMKMQIELRSPQDGIVKDLHVSAEDQVTQGQVLVTLTH